MRLLADRLLRDRIAVERKFSKEVIVKSPEGYAGKIRLDRHFLAHHLMFREQPRHGFQRISRFWGLGFILTVDVNRKVLSLHYLVRLRPVLYTLQWW